jgi:hypothetical protein
MACERDDITEIERSAREIGRVEDAVSGSTDPKPMPERIAFAIDFLTLRAAICFCRSDFALAGPFLSLVRGHSMNIMIGGLASLTGTDRSRPTSPCL